MSHTPLKEADLHALRRGDSFLVQLCVTSIHLVILHITDHDRHNQVCNDQYNRQPNKYNFRLQTGHGPIDRD